MKCRGGLWSPGRSQRAADDNNHTLCLCLFICSICRFPFLVCIILSHFFWFSFIISDTSPARICAIWLFSSLSFISACIFSALSGTFWLLLFFCVYWTVSLLTCFFFFLAILLSDTVSLSLFIHFSLKEWLHFGEKEFPAVFQRLNTTHDSTLNMKPQTGDS